MKKTKTVKTLTLVAFVILLTSFIAFKSRKLDRYLNSNSSRDQFNHSEQLSGDAQFVPLENVPIDTPRVKRADTIKFSPAMMSTSKSTIAIDQKLEFPIKVSIKPDSSKWKPKK